GAGRVRRRGIAGRVAQAHAAPVFKPALRATLSTKIWRSGATCRRRVVGRRGRACTPCSTLRPRGHPSTPNLTHVWRQFHCERIFIHASPRCAGVHGRPPAIGPQAMQWNARLECTAAKCTDLRKQEDQYPPAACLLAFGSVTFTASSQAIQRKTK